MKNYYGISMVPAKDITNDTIPFLASHTRDSNLLWFSSQSTALAYADSICRESPERMIAFMHIEDTFANPLPAPDIPGCIAIGGTKGHLSADLAYFPPVGFDSATEIYGATPYLYSPVITDLVRLVNAELNQVTLPADYTPKFASSDTIYVHYGSTEFDKDCFTPAYTRSFDMKPEDGFWACAKDAPSQWYDFCRAKQLRNDNPNCRMEFNLKPGAKVMKVETLDDIRYLMQRYPAQLQSGMSEATLLAAGLPHKAIDYEAASQELDGIEYSYTSLENLLGPWDCDSLVVFNPDVMEFREIELLPIAPGQKFDQDFDEYDDIAPGDLEDWDLE